MKGRAQCSSEKLNSRYYEGIIIYGKVDCGGY